MIKLIVSDMDGTLLRHDSTISKENLEAIKEAQRKGVQFAIATGRDYSSLKGLLEDHGLECFSILGNGAQFCNKEGTILSSAYFPKQRFKAVLKVLDDLNINYMIFAADGFYTTVDSNIVRDAFIERCIVRFGNQREDYFNDGPKHNMACMKLQKINDLDEFIDSSVEIIKVEAFDNDVSLIEQAKEKLQTIDDIAYLSSFDDNVEVTAFKAQKGLILEQIVKDAGLDKDEVMVIGDGLNDITLFEHFKYSFAPSNANELIKSMAYQVVASCQENGVKQAIEMMV